MTRRKEPTQEPVSERTTPHSLEAEKSVLGAILLNGAAIDAVAHVIQPQDFFRVAHRTIYNAMVRIAGRNEGIDLVTLKAELGVVLDGAGGPAYVTSLIDGVPRSANIQHYARIVKDHAIRRALIGAANEILGAAYEAETPAANVLAEADRSLLALQRGNVHGKMLTLSESRHDLMEDLDKRVNHRGELFGIDTGFPSVNELTNGWQRGDMNVIAARPSIGKTTFVVNSIVAGARATLARGGRLRAAIFSMEMKRKQLEYRILSALSGIPFTKILLGNIAECEWSAISEAMEVMGSLEIHIDDTAGRTAQQVRSECRRLIAEDGLDLAAIDYVQLMPGSLERRGANRTEELTDISRRLKTTAEELNIAMLVLSQLTRAAATERPNMSMLRESGSLEQDADTVALMHRKNHRDGGVTNLIFDKQRNGPTGTLNLTLFRDVVLFMDGGEEVAPPPPTEEEKKERKKRHFIGRARRS